MLERYVCRTRDDHVRALREILQQIALLGLWRAKFFEHAACYGGTALRVLYGLDRYSEDLDFSLLKPAADFTLGAYGDALCRELGSFGFEVSFENRKRNPQSAIDSAFVKANTLQQLIVIKSSPVVTQSMHAGPVMKIKWKTRVKGRDWYDLVWYVGHHPQVRLSHLEARMRHSGDWSGQAGLSRTDLLDLLHAAIERLDGNQARQEAERFVRDKAPFDLWSRSFFRQIVERIETV